MKKKLTHLDDQGRAQMVNVGHKPVTAREAFAEGYISLAPATLRAIADEKIPKRVEVISAKRFARIQLGDMFVRHSSFKFTA